jgi:hypothetical protein
VRGKNLRLGESSLFLINSREIGFIDARIKQVDVKTKNRITLVIVFLGFRKLYLHQMNLSEIFVFSANIHESVIIPPSQGIAGIGLE